MTYSRIEVDQLFFKLISTDIAVFDRIEDRKICVSSQFPLTLAYVPWFPSCQQYCEAKIDLIPTGSSHHPFWTRYMTELELLFITSLYLTW